MEAATISYRLAFYQKILAYSSFVLVIFSLSCAVEIFALIDNRHFCWPWFCRMSAALSIYQHVGNNLGSLTLTDRLFAAFN